MKSANLTLCQLHLNEAMFEKWQGGEEWELTVEEAGGGG